jgi:hypothetical protein
MPYYVRVLSPSESTVPATELAAVLQSACLTVEEGSDAQWGQLLLAHSDRREIAAIERNEVSDGSMAEEEIIHLLSAINEDDGWRELSAVKDKLWSQLGGILQADGEGFSNEDGYHIVWQFSEHVSGPWRMGVINQD